MREHLGGQITVKPEVRRYFSVTKENLHRTVYALWLTSQGVVDPHICDQFSAGGQEEMRLSSGEIMKFPGVYRRVKNNMDYFLFLMSHSDPVTLMEVPVASQSEMKKRLLKWCDLVSRNSTMNYDLSMDALQTLFFKGKHEI